MILHYDVRKIILRDSADEQFDDLITFDNDVDIADVIDAVERAKKKEDYTNEDVYKELAKVGDFTLEFIGQYNIIEY